jgi:hypothetical protein
MRNQCTIPLDAGSPHRSSSALGSIEASEVGDEWESGREDDLVSLWLKSSLQGLWSAFEVEKAITAFLQHQPASR